MKLVYIITFILLHIFAYYCTIFFSPLAFLSSDFLTHMYIVYVWSLIICPPDIRFSMDKQGHWWPYLYDYSQKEAFVWKKNCPKNEKKKGDISNPTKLFLTSIHLHIIVEIKRLLTFPRNRMCRPGRKKIRSITTYLISLPSSLVFFKVDFIT